VRVEGFGDIAACDFLVGAPRAGARIHPAQLLVVVRALGSRDVLAVGKLANLVAGVGREQPWVDLQLDARALRPGIYRLSVHPLHGFYDLGGVSQPVPAVGSLQKMFALTVWSSGAVFDRSPHPGQQIFSFGSHAIPYGAYALTSVGGPDGSRIGVAPLGGGDSFVAESAQSGLPEPLRILRDPAIGKLDTRLYSSTVRARRDFLLFCLDPQGNHWAVSQTLGQPFRVAGVYRVVATENLNVVPPKGGELYGVLTLDPILVDFSSFPADVARAPEGAMNGDYTHDDRCVHAWAFFLDPAEVARKLL